MGGMAGGEEEERLRRSFPQKLAREEYKHIKMQSVIRQLEDSQNYKEGLRGACRTSRIPYTILSKLTTPKMRLFSQRTLRHYKGNPVKAKTTWYENELRLFYWILVVKSFLKATPLRQLDEPEWQHIQSLFFPKSLEMLQFEARKLLSLAPEEQHRPWSADECLLLSGIMSDPSYTNKWNEVSREFYERSGKQLYRSGKQCREQWFNHLDSTKKHGQWTAEEDRVILAFVIKHGHKWAQLCREALPSRTEHMSKNRFKSLVARFAEGKGLSERKIIKKMLAERDCGRSVRQGAAAEEAAAAAGSSFKILNLKTYHTEPQEEKVEEDSLLDRMASGKSIQIINNSCGERQNQQEEKIARKPLKKPSLSEQRPENPENPPAAPLPGALYSPFCQITEGEMQTTNLSPYLPTYYALYSTPLLYTSFLPFPQ